MHLHLVLSDNLAEASAQADELRSRARALLVTAVADAHQAGMTQREIAAKLNRSQPEVSRLLKLSPPRFRARTPLGQRLVEHRHELVAALEAGGATNVRVFGSLARGEDGETSDIDLLIDIPNRFSLFDLGGLQVAAERILDDPVDVIPARGLKGLIRSTALEDAIPL